MIEIQDAQALESSIQQNQIIIVQFGSENCGPCKALQNRIKTWNLSHPSVSHAYITVSQLPELCAQMGVFTVPTIFVYVEGKLTTQQSGYFSLDQMLVQVERYEYLLAR